MCFLFSSFYLFSFFYSSSFSCFSIIQFLLFLFVLNYFLFNTQLISSHFLSSLLCVSYFLHFIYFRSLNPHLSLFILIFSFFYFSLFSITFSLTPSSLVLTFISPLCFLFSSFHYLFSFSCSLTFIPVLLEGPSFLRCTALLYISRRFERFSASVFRVKQSVDRAPHSSLPASHWRWRH